MMGGGLSPSRPSGVKEEGAEHPGADAAQAGAAVQGGEEVAGARKRTQQERSPARAGMASSKLRKADDVTRAGGSRGEEEGGEGEAAEGRQLYFHDSEALIGEDLSDLAPYFEMAYMGEEGEHGNWFWLAEDEVAEGEGPTDTPETEGQCQAWAGL